MHRSHTPPFAALELPPLAKQAMIRRIAESIRRPLQNSILDAESAARGAAENAAMTRHVNAIPGLLRQRLRGGDWKSDRLTDMVFLPDLLRQNPSAGGPLAELMEMGAKKSIVAGRMGAESAAPLRKKLLALLDKKIL